MAEQATSGFAGLLRQLRAEAQLTQQELAKVAGVSPRAVSDLERGINRTARHDTAVQLAGALGLAEPARSLFVAAALGRIQAAQVLTARSSQPPGEPRAGDRLAADRHRSLAATVEWSYQLLEDREQRVSRMVSVFPGPSP
jgi:transcriptional regulator with XRE-family HTH domain